MLSFRTRKVLRRFALQTLPPQSGILRSRTGSSSGDTRLSAEAAKERLEIASTSIPPTASATPGASGWGHPRLSPEIIAGLAKAMDFCLVQLSAVIAFIAYQSINTHSITGPEQHFSISVIAAIVLVLSFQRIDGYSLRRLAMLRWQLARLLTLWAIIILVLLLSAFLVKMSDTFSRAWIVSWIVTGLVLIIMERIVLWLAIIHGLGNGYLARNIVIVGAGEQGQRLIAKLQESQERSIAIRGIFDDRRSRIPSVVSGRDVLGTTDDLIHFARWNQVDEAIIALPLGSESRLKQIVDKLKVLPIDLCLSIGVMAENIPVRGMSRIGVVPIIEIAERPIKNWSAVVKWGEDKVLGTLALLLAAPVMGIIALLIKLDSPGPVFFIQERFGFNNNGIRVLKFRTMYSNLGDSSGALRTLREDPRVTRIGRVLRTVSLDELPQLINVLKGDMSLVGPRPHAITMRAGNRLYADAVEEYFHRHRVRPGMTGWAQVNGCRGEIDTVGKAHSRVEHDLWYIENWSIWLDLKILAMTLPVMLSGRNAY